ncbi:hypothetical protein [Cetobacterium ceti]
MKIILLEHITVKESNNEISLIDKNVQITGTIIGDEKTHNIVGIQAIDSTINNFSDIHLDGKNSIGILSDKSITKKEIKVINNGMISIKGENSCGIFVKNGVQGINNGKIIGKYQELYVDSIKNILDNTGMIAKNGSSVINNKIIEMNSAKIIDNNNNIYSKVIGIKVENGNGENNGTIQINGHGTGISISNNSKAINNGKIIGISKPNFNGSFLNNSIIKGMVGENQSTIINEKNGEILLLNDGQGISISNNSKAINNGKIAITGSENWNYHIIGMEIEDNSNGINNGTITVTGSSENKGMVADLTSSIINNGVIEVESTGGYAYGMDDYSSEQIITKNPLINNGTIKVAASGKVSETIPITAVGISASRDTINNGKIIAKAEQGGEATGIRGYINKTILTNDINGSIFIEGIGQGMLGNLFYNENSPINHIQLKNNGKIIIENNGLVEGNSYGMKNIGGKTINNGSIIMSGEFNKGDADGMNITQGIGINEKNGKIEINSGTDPSAGMFGKNSTLINNGQIKVESKAAAYGMLLHNGGSATNNGTINIMGGEGSCGIIVIDGKAINSKTGVITVSGENVHGIIASGNEATVDNQGVININNLNNAINISNGATMKNTGIIQTIGNFHLDSSTGTYIIGTTSNGEYGQLKGKNITLNGNINVDTSITTSGFKKEYLLQNIVESENIQLGEDFKITSNSLLYDISTCVDTWGNLDGTLIRNNYIISDFSNKKFIQTAKIFDKYFTENEFRNLNSDAKEIISTINTENISSLNSSLKNLTPSLYTNIGRQLLNLSETFKEQSSNTIQSLDKNKFNFSFIGSYKDINSRKEIEGYKSQLSGFIGSFNLKNNLYGSIGYGYSDINYTGEANGNIQTIHLGLDKYINFNSYNIAMSIFTEYNFHENSREIKTFNRKAKSNFDSYSFGSEITLSKIYQNTLTIKPYLGTSIGSYSYKTFSETGANSINATISSQNYTLFEPKLGIYTEKAFKNLKIYSDLVYSYNFGNFNKTQKYTYESFDGKGQLSKDNLENGNTKLLLGLNSTINNITFWGTVGKNFGKTNDFFSQVSLEYKF